MKYTAEEVRARFEAWAEENGYDVLRIEPDYNDGFTAAAWHGYQAAYAERIKADEGAVTDVIVEAARKAYRSVETRELCPVCGGTGRKHDNFTQCEHCEGSMWTNMADAPDPMRAALLAVWPNPPAQAAQVDPAAKPRTLADFVNASDAERVQIGQQVAARVDEMMAEPVAQPSDSGRVPDGLVLVPREPTAAMLDAAMTREDDEPLTDWGKIIPAPHAEIYKAMLAAAPQPGESA